MAATALFLLSVLGDGGRLGGDGHHFAQSRAFGAVSDLCFFNGAGLFILLGAEFLAMILVVVYVGAVVVLFLFVVMMLDVDFAELRQGMLNYLPIGGTIGLILLVELVLTLGTWVVSPEAGRVARRPIAAPWNRSPIPRPWGGSSTRNTSIIFSRPAWCCWSP